MIKVFIAGSAGTTGLRLHSRLKARSDVSLISISEDKRKDPDEIQRLMAQADCVFLCLPDDAASALALSANDTGAKLIDTSTAHRTAEGWAYGFPELSERHRSAIIDGGRVAVPGCHASGFISLIYPLISAGVLPPETLLSCTSLTGYSGGGKKMIADYENPRRANTLKSSNLYAMSQQHKHLPEMLYQCGLSHPPAFLPIVGDYYSGMLVTVPLNAALLKNKCSADDVRQILKAHYSGGMVTVLDDAPSSLFAGAMSGYDDMQLFVSGSAENILLCALFDNLGKGASGAAIECFNLMFGFDADEGLCMSRSGT